MQDYKSGIVNDIGKKTTISHVKDEYYNWKIIAEKWSKNGISPSSEQIAFQTSYTFFQNRQTGKNSEQEG